MSTSLVIRRGIGRGFHTLRRERKWSGALGALFGVFVLLQLLVLVWLGLQGAQTLLRSRTDLRLEIRADASDEAIQDFYSALQELPFIERAVFITKEQAYDQTRKTNPDLITFLEEFNFTNPFTDVIGVTLVSLDDYESFSSFIERPQWQEVVDPTFLSTITDQERNIEQMIRLTDAGRSLTMVIMAVTVLSLVFITMELIRSRALARSDEVLVEKLSGASTFAILIPFVTEAIFLFFCALLLSTLAMTALAFVLPMVLPALQAGGAFWSLQQSMIPTLRTLLPLILGGELLVLPFVAFAGAWLGIRPQVKTTAFRFAL